MTALTRALAIAFMTLVVVGCQKAPSSTPASEPAAEAQPAAKPNPTAAPGVEVTYERRNIITMSTRLDLMLPAGPGADSATEKVREVFEQVALRANEWRPESPLSAVNTAAGGAAVAVPADVRALLHKGLRLGERTGGAFDVTWAALWGMWDFRAKESRPPDPAESAKRITLVDWRAVEIDDKAGTVRLKRAGMKLGLGGIAKGWALDRAAEALSSDGVGTFMMSAGGQVRVAGGRSGRPWRVGIRDPRGSPSDYFAIIELSEGNVSTSGDYERFFIYKGLRYHHILDPRTGQPARDLRSATVLAASGTDADALSTAFMVMGRHRALALVAADATLEAVLVDNKGKVHVSAGMDDKLRILHPPKP